MGTPRLPQPVKLLMGLLAADTALFAQAAARLEAAHGRIDLESAVFPWETTDYYRAEMGDHLLRRFVTFEQLIMPEDLIRLKLEANELEYAFAVPPGPASPRRVNLDPGYIDTTKLVLASTKAQAHRLYLSQGIYAEVTLLYHHAAYHPFVYTYADYRWPETHDFLKQARTKYLKQLRGRQNTV